MHVYAHDRLRKNPMCGKILFQVKVELNDAVEKVTDMYKDQGFDTKKLESFTVQVRSCSIKTVRKLQILVQAYLILHNTGKAIVSETFIYYNILDRFPPYGSFSRLLSEKCHNNK